MFLLKSRHQLLFEQRKFNRVLVLNFLALWSWWLDHMFPVVSGWWALTNDIRLSWNVVLEVAEKICANNFWVQGLSTPFCKVNLPRYDCPVILEDESEEQFEVKYIAEKTGLSAGWRKFATGHKLLEGDVLLFQLVGPTKFKVTLEAFWIIKFTILKINYSPTHNMLIFSSRWNFKFSLYRC